MYGTRHLAYSHSKLQFSAGPGTHEPVVTRLLYSEIQLLTMRECDASPVLASRNQSNEIGLCRSYPSRAEIITTSL